MSRQKPKSKPTKVTKTPTTHVMVTRASLRDANIRVRDLERLVQRTYRTLRYERHLLDLALTELAELRGELPIVFRKKWLAIHDGETNDLS